MLLRKEVRISVPPCGNTEGAATTAEKPGVASHTVCQYPEDSTLQSHPQGQTAGRGGGVVLVMPSVELPTQSFLQTEVSAGILSQPPVSHTHPDSGSTRPGLTLLKIWLTKEAEWPPSSPRGPPSLLPGTGIARACRNTQLLMWLLGVKLKSASQMEPLSQPKTWT